jgi:hypothetical protein
MYNLECFAALERLNSFGTIKKLQAVLLNGQLACFKTQFSQIAGGDAKSACDITCAELGI